jgi:hypothetical protein
MSISAKLTSLTVRILAYDSLPSSAHLETAQVFLCHKLSSAAEYHYDYHDFKRKVNAELPP